jgi:drug/metabolite transporter (DMT)-like permease
MFKNWKTTLLGVVVATLGGFAAVDHWDQLSPRDALLALGGCFLLAIKSALTADANKPE